MFPISPVASKASLAVILIFAGTVRAAENPPTIQFGRDILPILSNNCFTCHGPDEKTRKAKLRLDTRGGAMSVLTPGDSRNSELIRRINAADVDGHMPPPRTQRRLSAEQKALLRRWVDEGAPWGQHWAFEKPLRPGTPKLQGSSRARNPIDVFVLKRLRKEGIRPSPEADRQTLIRRVSLDLAGRPPTAGEVDEFLQDRSSAAYEKVVDRLLASPRYGERMALDWLDEARYADTNGYQNDFARTMWPWRDWVINAFNHNQPFDRFVVEQIAGDLLPGATMLQRIATGFNRNNRTVTEGGSIEEEWRIENAVDRVETTGTVFLGLTIGCARCHDHKFDPISQKEFYQFLAFFNSLDEKGVYTEQRGNVPPMVTLSSPRDEARIKQLTASLADAERAASALEARLAGPLQRWEQRQRSAAALQGIASMLTWRLVKTPPAKERSEKMGTGSAGRRACPHFFRTLKGWNSRYESLVRTLVALAKTRLRAAKDEAERRRKEKTEYERHIPTVMVMQDARTTRDTFVLKRGSYDQPDKSQKVEPDVPGFAARLPAVAPRNRLGLAQWLVSADNPLTARVTVNKFWQHYFGVGLVKTAENFGTRGELPSHPELLDWLATEFVRSGWNVKAMQRLIVTSATYRQTSKTDAVLLHRDPENRLLARGPRFRLPAEVVRDNALAISGLLVEKVGGPSVKPYQPAGLWEELAGGAGEGPYVQDKGSGLYRRSLYIYRKRTVPHPALTTFDASSREVCQVERARTDTPLQALELLNDVTYVEAARRLAERMLREGGRTPEERLAFAFRRATARVPTTVEMRVLARGLARQEQRFQKDPGAAGRLIRHGDSVVDAKIDPVELAAYTAVAAVILNLDETITKE